MEESNVEYITFKLQSEKILKFILNGLVPNIPTDVAKKNFEDAGTKIKNDKQFEKMLT